MHCTPKIASMLSTPKALEERKTVGGAWTKKTEIAAEQKELSGVWGGNSEPHPCQLGSLGAP